MWGATGRIGRFAAKKLQQQPRSQRQLTLSLLIHRIFLNSSRRLLPSCVLN